MSAASACSGVLPVSSSPSPSWPWLRSTQDCRGDHADARLRPEHARPASEGARLDGGAEFAGLRVAGDDRVGQDASARIFAFHSRLSA
jgi:hypothetical protein